MAGKALSNGTLSLRFMQNAARAKQLATAELEQAKVKDEAEWEVSSSVKASWGIGNGQASTSEVTYESSYLPFINSAAEAFTIGLPTWRGRRTFNARGEETSTAETAPEPQTVDSTPETKDWSKGARRPVTISGSSATVMTARKEKDRDGQKPKSSKPAIPGKSAKLVIHEDANVGEDLRRRRAAVTTTIVANATVAVPAPTPANGSSGMAFLKPAGVDSAGAFVKPAGVDAPTTGSGSKRSGDTLDDQKTKKKKKKSKPPVADVE